MSLHSQDFADGLLRVETGEAVGRLILNNPERKNALNLAAWRALPDAAALLAATKTVRVVIVTGTGTSFCAGADIAEFEATRSTAEKARDYDHINVCAFDALKALAKPTICMIRGHCLGGGLGVALACDMRLASTTASFGIPAARLGLAYPPRALTHLLQATSASNAKRMLFTASRFTAAQSLSMGLVDESVEDGLLETRTEELANAIAANAPLTLKAAKVALDGMSLSSRADELALAQQLADACAESADFAEGRRAFLEKHTPRFEGQ